jgi:hypothetical protein
MSTKTISITEDAYERLRSLKETERMSFSEVILKYYPKRRSLSEIPGGDRSPPGRGPSPTRSRGRRRSSGRRG